MKGETSALPLFSCLKVLPEAECTGQARVNCSLAPRGGVGGGQLNWFLAWSCFYNSLSTDLCPHPGLSWEFLRRSSLNLRN